jgi:hypothetical protein
MQITGIEFHRGSGMWHGTASEGDKKYMFYYLPRSLFHMTEQDEMNPRCWMNIEPREGARQIVLRAVRRRGAPNLALKR